MFLTHPAAPGYKLFLKNILTKGSEAQAFLLARPRQDIFREKFFKREAPRERRRRPWM
jgi:hypothetical protein